MERARRELPALRAGSHAGIISLREIANGSPARGYVDLIIVPPEAGWAERVIADLQEKLPKAKIATETYRDYQPTLTSEDLFAKRCRINLGWWQDAAREKVRQALLSADGVDVDYLSCIHLLVASPTHP
jgi:hypothetical protein